MNTCVILGTRPEVIKMSPVIRACESQEGAGLDYYYSYNMDQAFFEQLELPDAKYNPDVGSGSGRYGEQSERMMAGMT